MAIPCCESALRRPRLIPSGLWPGGPSEISRWRKPPDPAHTPLSPGGALEAKPPEQKKSALLLRLAIALLCLALPAAASARDSFEAVAHQTPELKLERYFAGRTHSWGVFETSSGAPKEVLRGRTEGRAQGGVLRFEQDLHFSSGKKMHRSWRIRRVDAHHYEATGTGIIGVARAEAHGNALHLEFTLDAIPGNPLGRVHMSQWLYLQSDGRTLINRAKLTKAGVRIAELTEYFQKER